MSVTSSTSSSDPFQHKEIIDIFFATADSESDSEGTDSKNSIPQQLSTFLGEEFNLLLRSSDMHFGRAFCDIEVLNSSRTDSARRESFFNTLYICAQLVAGCLSALGEETGWKSRCDPETLPLLENFARKNPPKFEEKIKNLLFLKTLQSKIDALFNEALQKLPLPSHERGEEKIDYLQRVLLSQKSGHFLVTLRQDGKNIPLTIIQKGGNRECTFHGTGHRALDSPTALLTTTFKDWEITEISLYSEFHEIESPDQLIFTDRQTEVEDLLKKPPLKNFFDLICKKMERETAAHKLILALSGSSSIGIASLISKTVAGDLTGALSLEEAALFACLSLFQEIGSADCPSILLQPFFTAQKDELIFNYTEYLALLNIQDGLLGVKKRFSPKQSSGMGEPMQAMKNDLINAFKNAEKTSYLLKIRIEGGFLEGVVIQKNPGNSKPFHLIYPHSEENIEQALFAYPEEIFDYLLIKNGAPLIFVEALAFSIPQEPLLPFNFDDLIKKTIEAISTIGQSLQSAFSLSEVPQKKPNLLLQAEGNEKSLGAYIRPHEIKVFAMLASAAEYLEETLETLSAKLDKMRKPPFRGHLYLIALEKSESKTPLEDIGPLPLSTQSTYSAFTIETLLHTLSLLHLLYQIYIKNHDHQLEALWNDFEHLEILKTMEARIKGGHPAFSPAHTGNFSEIPQIISLIEETFIEAVFKDSSLNPVIHREFLANVHIERAIDHLKPGELIILDLKEMQRAPYSRKEVSWLIGCNEDGSFTLYSTLLTTTGSISLKTRKEIMNHLATLHGSSIFTKLITLKKPIADQDLEKGKTSDSFFHSALTTQTEKSNSGMQEHEEVLSEAGSEESVVIS